jgi:hypothetical protein
MFHRFHPRLAPTAHLFLHSPTACRLVSRRDCLGSAQRASPKSARGAAPGQRSNATQSPNGAALIVNAAC